MITCKFSSDDLKQANEEWGCNCGPSALAFALQTDLNAVRQAVSSVGFDHKRYINPTMMSQAVQILRGRKKNVQCPCRNAEGGLDVEPMFPDAEMASDLSLVRVQWTGQWTAPGANQRWAYGKTHWIVTWTERGVALVFDCNCGISGFESWENEIVYRITESIPRSDGGWYPTHIWRVLK